MNQSLIAIRYAKALYKLAMDRDTLDAVSSDLAMVGQALAKNSELLSFLKNPLYKVSQKKGIVSGLFAEKCSEPTIQFLNMVIDNRRESLLESIIRDFGDLYRTEKGIKRVVFTSPTQPSPGFSEKLKGQLEAVLGCHIELTLREKKELIGGFVLLVDGKLVDASILNRLKQMEKKLLEL